MRNAYDFRVSNTNLQKRSSMLPVRKDLSKDLSPGITKPTSSTSAQS
jgi:hypothetical protein